MLKSAALTLDWLPLDRESIPQSALDIDAKTRANLLPWKGQFSPQLVHALLSVYAKDGAHVLDPFVGSGTVLVEAARSKLRATGAEINPAAVTLARVYSQCNVGPGEREAALLAAGRIIDAQFTSEVAIQPLDIDAPPRDLPRITSAILAETAPPVRDLIAATLVLADFGAPTFTRERLFSAWSQVRRLVMQLPHSDLPVRILQSDARTLPLPSREVDLVLTSPPYINVFNYHQQYRPAVEELGWDVLEVAQSEIGSNRKHRTNRFLTVIQYCLDLAGVFEELKRVTRSEARIVFVIGRESLVRGQSIRNGELLLNLATRSCGLRALARQERKFTNRFGQLIYEDILHFDVPPLEGPTSGVAPKDLAVEVLSRLLTDSPTPDVREDIEQAVLDVDSIRPSRLYRPPAAKGLASTS